MESEAAYWMWIVFPLTMLLILGGIIFLIAHFWNLTRKRDKQTVDNSKETGK